MKPAIEQEEARKLAWSAVEISWEQPFFSDWKLGGIPVFQDFRNGHAMYAALQKAANAHSMPVNFVAQSALPPSEAYETFIFNTGTVPTRNNLHDFFNGLCWIQFPLTKRRLNALQAGEISRAGGASGMRGPLRDALTLFDENAAVLSAPSVLWNALLARDWQHLFIDLRPLWAQTQLVLFGHALLEKLVSPRKGITAHVYRAQAAMNSIAELDAWLASDLNAAKLATKPFTPLPVLGVPGWCKENENPAFYCDDFVFRKSSKTRLVS